jgi:hypothetical protein
MARDLGQRITEAWRQQVVMTIAAAPMVRLAASWWRKRNPTATAC